MTLTTLVSRPDLNLMAQRVHQANAKWWTDLETGERLNRNKNELLMLVVSEVAEALEGERKSRPDHKHPDDKLPNRPMAEVEIADVLIRCLDFSAGCGIPLTWDTFPIRMYENRGESLLQLVGAVVRLSDFINKVSDYDAANTSYLLSVIVSGCFAYCEKFGYDLMGAYEEKMVYNANRADHSIEARKLAGGKAF